MADSKPSWANNEDDADDDEEIDDTNYRHLKDAVLFAVEVSPSMLEDGDESSIRAALACAYQMMQQRIITNPSDMIGILLFGTEKSRFLAERSSASNASLTYPHCYLLMDLDIPEADDIKMLKRILEGDEETAEIFRASQESVSMSNLLFCANQIFTTKAPNFISRRLFIITDNDNPHSKEKEKSQRSAAIVRAKDLYDLGVTIELFPINQPRKEFDKSKFYDDIIYSSFPQDPNAPAKVAIAEIGPSSGKGTDLLNSLRASINSRSSVKRAQFSNMPPEIGPGFTISVKGYIFFKRQTPARGCYVYVGGEKPQLAKGVSSQMTDDSSRKVEKEEMRKAFPFGGEQILFTEEEMAKLKNFGEPAIRIIGFKPLSMLPAWACLKPASFIYPSEEDYIGSTRVFSALHQKLLKDSKMALTWYIARRNASPVMAALIAGAERLDSDGVQVVPPGMWLMQIPFADDIRQNPESILVRAPDPVVDSMRTIIQQLSLPQGVYRPEKYPNPSLQWHYRILQAMALDEDLPEKPEDKTVPKYKQIHKRIEPFVKEWEHELDVGFRDWSHKSSTAGTKREPSPSNSTTLPKRSKK